jgi:dCTP deaminase
MILTGKEIYKQVEAGRIKISPFNRDQLNPNSYNFRLGNRIKYYVNNILDPKFKQDVHEVIIDSEGFVLYPDKIYLGHTLETMGSDYYVPMIKGRSSTARLGLFIHVTSDIIDIGSHNQWTLQLHSVHPLRLYPGMLIGQVTFWTVKGEIELYKGRYQGTKGPCESLIYQDFPDNKK